MFPQISQRFTPGFRMVDGADLNRLADQANGAFSVGSPGNNYFVDTVNGHDSRVSGDSWAGAFKTMARAFEEIGDNDTIWFVGKVREQLVAPLGVTGVSIIGAAGGNTRDDDGAKWYAPASPVAGKALIEILQQGWTFANFLMTPDATGGACIKAHRNEDATYPDSSHFICSGVRFVGAGGTPIGIEDVGGNHHYIVDNCEFQTLTTALLCSSTSIAVPLRNTITNNKFFNNTNDIDSAQSYSLLQGNRHFSAAATKVVVIAGGEYNMVTGNVFPDDADDIDPASGYDGNATDTWTGNLVANQAAYAFGDPA